MVEDERMKTYHEIKKREGSGFIFFAYLGCQLACNDVFFDERHDHRGLSEPKILKKPVAATPKATITSIIAAI